MMTESGQWLQAVPFRSSYHGLVNEHPAFKCLHLGINKQLAAGLGSVDCLAGFAVCLL